MDFHEIPRWNRKHFQQITEAAPQMVHTFNEQTLVPGPFVTLRCSAVGNPAPDISWLLDRQPIAFQQLSDAR